MVGRQVVIRIEELCSLGCGGVGVDVVSGCAFNLYYVMWLMYTRMEEKNVQPDTGASESPKGNKWVNKGTNGKERTREMKGAKMRA